MPKATKTLSQSTNALTLEELLGRLLGKVVRLKRNFIDMEIKQLGLSRTEWQVLYWIKTLCPCSQKELLHNLDIDGPHLARTLDKLEKNKYIMRSPLQNDRRSLLIRITDHAKKHLLPHLEAAIKKEKAILFQGFNLEEKKQLNNFLNKIEANIESGLIQQKTEGKHK